MGAFLVEWRGEMVHPDWAVEVQGKWVIDKTKSYMENNYMLMQKKGELEILNHKPGPDGKTLFHVRWGGHETTSHFYTWEPESRLQLAKKELDEYFDNPANVKV